MTPPPDTKTCTKDCGAVFHMTGHRHLKGCDLFDDSPGCPSCGAPRPELHPSPYKPCPDAFHTMKVQHLYRDKLAERLGVTPKERLSITLVQQEEPRAGKVLLLVSALIDGGDLTPGQEEVFQKFLNEVGVETLAIFPEKPVTS